MRLTSITVTDLLALHHARVDVDAPTTVITGPNGSGKSTLLAAVRLANDAVNVAAAAANSSGLEATWGSAGYENSASFEVRIGMRFDTDTETQLIEHFYRGSVLSVLHPEACDFGDLTDAIDSRLPPQCAASMFAGELVVRRDERQRFSWNASWEFELPAGRGFAHVQLMGEDPNRLRAGRVAEPAPRGNGPAHELAPSTNDIAAKVRDGRINPSLLDFVADRNIEFSVTRTNTNVQAPSVAAVLAALNLPALAGRDRATFASVLQVLLSHGMHVTNNHHCLPRTSFDVAELATVPDLSDGSLLALEVNRLKNGLPRERVRFAVLKQIFTELTGGEIDCTQTVDQSSGKPIVHIVPVIKISTTSGGVIDVPLERAGAGASEALFLATLLSDERRCLFLDEPSVHSSPTRQRALLARLRRRGHGSGQTVWITHNPDLVPVRDQQDLAAIVRLCTRDGSTSVHRLISKDQKDSAANVRMLALSSVRSMLFAAGVVLCEGSTDLAAFQRWVDDGVSHAGTMLPTPDDLNVTLLSVDGQGSFGPVAELAERLGVPWAILSDGPALRPGGPLAKRLANLGREAPAKGASLSDVRDEWAAIGVYSFAANFGDDGSKGGELEVFLERINPVELARARRTVGSAKGHMVGAAFAAAVTAPQEVSSMWADLLRTLDLYT